MLSISVWDEIGCEWSTRKIDLPPTCRDAQKINKALDADDKFDIEIGYEEDDDSGWEITKTTDTGNLLIIEGQSDRGHQSIILVNYKAQDD